VSCRHEFVGSQPLFSKDVSTEAMEYQATTDEDMGDTYAVVTVAYRVCRSVEILQLHVVTIYKSLINSIIYSNLMSSH
jgi:hypothetical protein